MEIDEKSVTKVIYVVSQCRNSGSKEDALEMQDTLLFKGEKEKHPSSDVAQKRYLHVNGLRRLSVLI